MNDRLNRVTLERAGKAKTLKLIHPILSAFVEQQLL